MGDSWIKIEELQQVLKVGRMTAFRLVKKFQLVAQPAPRTSRNGKRPTLILLESLYNLPACKIYRKCRPSNKAHVLRA